MKANKIGSFVMGGETFHVVRPGFDIQGRKRTAWTQVVHEDIPVYESRLDVPLDQVLKRFEEQFDALIGDDRKLLAQALKQTKAEHRKKFKDGVSGVEPAPTSSQDGRATGREYPA